MAAPCLLSPAGSALAPLETSPRGPRCQAQGDEGRENVGPQSLLLVYVHYQTACTEGACVVLMWLPEWPKQCQHCQKKQARLLQQLIRLKQKSPCLQQTSAPEQEKHRKWRGGKQEQVALETGGVQSHIQRVGRHLLVSKAALLSLVCHPSAYLFCLFLNCLLQALAQLSSNLQLPKTMRRQFAWRRLTSASSGAELVSSLADTMTTHMQKQKKPMHVGSSTLPELTTEISRQYYNQQKIVCRPFHHLSPMSRSHAHRHVQTHRRLPAARRADRTPLARQPASRMSPSALPVPIKIKRHQEASADKTDHCP
ncbi:hypothetical protein Anapl_04156 [Anas platyrhynchos]|uniref:Uncharacterized protein n=1 Tax=Anas platyrhynchos TaxID=8839 RepID=R0LSW9_ANAPL|nr:hypothetical protein Anapl_04156 [Anas platyrhynchos]